MKKRLLSGIKPTGDIHIGNYFGAIKQFIEMQNSGEYESFVFVADLHALNQIHNPKILSHNIIEVVKIYLACGLDPDKINLFRQSDIKQVSELCTILNAITPMSMMKLAHAYKDATAKNKTVNMGLFDYPVLMASDILIYKSDIVPVGQDQLQHIEMAREIAKIFNNTYGATFKIPQEIIQKNTALIKGLDGRKMSKSYNNGIGLFDDEKTVAKKVMSIVTDSRKPEESKDPETCNIFYFHKLFSPEKELKEIANRYREGKISYKESKEILVANLNKFLTPLREKKKELDADEKSVIKILEKGKEKALKIAEEIMKEIKEKVGLKIAFAFSFCF